MASPLLVTLIFLKRGFGDAREIFEKKGFAREIIFSSLKNLFLSQNLRTRPSPVASGNPPCFPREIQQQQQKREATLKEGAEVQSPIL